MANPRRQETEPIKLVTLRLPHSIYEQLKDAPSLNAEIVRLLRVALETEKNDALESVLRPL